MLSSPATNPEATCVETAEVVVIKAVTVSVLNSGRVPG
jgi:hypothetical protein